ncbi:hypothetical protein AgCh_018402 [Apium graveolens]
MYVASVLFKSINRLSLNWQDNPELSKTIDLLFLEIKDLCEDLILEIWVLPPNFIKLAKDVYMSDFIVASDCKLGTPIQNGTMDLFSLMAFLRYQLFANKSYWNTLVQRPIDIGDKIGLSRLQGALDGGLDIPHSEKQFAGYSKDSK